MTIVRMETRAAYRAIGSMGPSFGLLSLGHWDLIRHSSFVIRYSSLRRCRGSGEVRCVKKYGGYINPMRIEFELTSDEFFKAQQAHAANSPAQRIQNDWARQIVFMILVYGFGGVYYFYRPWADPGRPINLVLAYLIFPPIPWIIVLANAWFVLYRRKSLRAPWKPGCRMGSTKPAFWKRYRRWILAGADDRIDFCARGGVGRIMYPVAGFDRRQRILGAGGRVAFANLRLRDVECTADNDYAPWSKLPGLGTSDATSHTARF